MELAELTAYAKEKYRMEEQRRWPQLPGFSLLCHPATGRRVALLMRQWDSEGGRMVERCDLKCGPLAPGEGSRPYLCAPTRMRGPAWVGVAFGPAADSAVLLQLFDRAVAAEGAGGYTLVLPEPAPEDPKGGTAYHDTPLPFLKGVTRGFAPSRPGDRPAEAHAADARPAGTKASPAEKAPDPQIPERIRQMLALYEYGDNTPSLRAKNFYRQGKLMEDYADDAPWAGEYWRYFTTYHDLNLPQLRGYFSWRARLRQGDFRPIATSLAYLYLYELLNGIGAASPADALRRMRAFEEGYLGAGFGDYSMRKNLRRWMFEYAVLQGLPAEQVRACAEPRLLERDDALAVLKSPGLHADEEVFSALCSLSEKGTPAGSPAVTKGGERAKRLFAQVWVHLSEQYRGGGGALFAACFGEQKSYNWYPLSNAVYYSLQPLPDADLELNSCRAYRRRGGLWQEERYDGLYFDRPLFEGILHAADRALRRYFKTGHYLRERPEEGWLAPYLAAVIEADRRAQREARRPKVAIDLSSLEQIRQAARITRDRLLTEEERAEEGLGGEGQAGAVAARAERTFREGAAGHPAAEPAAEGPAAKPATGLAGTPADGPAAARGEKPAAGPAEAPAAPFGLEPLQLQILTGLLRGQPVEGQIKSRRLMPSILADSINTALLDEIGDNILESDGDRLTLVEEYREEVAGILLGGGRDE